MTKFKTGQQVWSVQEGWTYIEYLFIEPHIQSNGDYQVITLKDSYTLDGRHFIGDKHPSLYTYDALNGTEPPTIDAKCYIALYKGMHVSELREQPQSVKDDWHIGKILHDTWVLANNS